MSTSVSPHFFVGNPLSGVEHEKQNHLISVNTEDMFLSLAMAPCLTGCPLSHFSPALCPCLHTASIFLLTPEEERVKICCACARLQSEYPTAVLGQVEVLEYLEGLSRHTRQVDRRRRVLSRPKACGEHAYAQVNAVQVLASVSEVSLELIVDTIRESHVFEHALQLGCELTATL